jgi:hypothetical protein
MSIHRSLGRLCGIGRKWWTFHLEWHKIFGAAAILFLGGAIGGGIAMIPFLAAHPSHVAKREFIWLLAIDAAVGIGCLIARFAVRQQQVESIRSVYEAVDEIVRGYEGHQTAGTQRELKR